MIIPGLLFMQGRTQRTPSTKYGVAIHATDNARLASARDEATYATRRTDSIGSHLYTDKRETIQSHDTRFGVNHAGSGHGNNNAVAVEVVGTTSKSRQWWIDNTHWESLGYALAQVCKEHGIPVRRCSVAEMRANPRVKGFYSHNDMRLAWGRTTHTDPGDNFPWDVLFASINRHMGNPPAPIEGDEDLTPEQDARLKRIDERLTTMFYGMDENTFPDGGPMDNEDNALKAQLDRIERAVTPPKDGV